jgi:hypothetical protein
MVAVSIYSYGEFASRQAAAEQSSLSAPAPKPCGPALSRHRFGAIELARSSSVAFKKSFVVEQQHEVTPKKKSQRSAERIGTLVAE